MREFLKSIPPVRKTAELLRYGLFSIKLRLAEREDLHHPKDGNGIAIPPARLRHRVHGDFDLERFLQVGHTVAADLQALVQRAGRRWSEFADVLNFGCGCARVMRNLLPGTPALFTGTDIDPELIHWCRQFIPGVNWHTNGYLPPTRYGDGGFDMVYAISVFTHLDEAYQTAWLEELQRITRPGAILILTVHGEPVIANAPMTSEQRARLQHNGFLFVTGTTGKLKLDGLPDFYQTAYHLQDYVSRVWGAFFDVVAQVPQGINHHQNAVVLRRR